MSRANVRSSKAFERFCVYVGPGKKGVLQTCCTAFLNRSLIDYVSGTKQFLEFFKSKLSEPQISLFGATLKQHKHIEHHKWYDGLPNHIKWNHAIHVVGPIQIWSNPLQGVESRFSCSVQLCISTGPSCGKLESHSCCNSVFRLSLKSSMEKKHLCMLW